MKKVLTYIFAIIVVLLFVLMLSRCIKPRIPPSFASIERKMSFYQNNIDTITSYMIALPYENIYIDSLDGSMLTDLTDREISDKSVKNAVRRMMLLNNDVYFSKHGNTIYINLWTHFQAIQCGIAYTINGVDMPEVEFSTEMRPMSTEGWYYVVADYNKWRTNQSGQSSNTVTVTQGTVLRRGTRRDKGTVL